MFKKVMFGLCTAAFALNATAAFAETHQDKVPPGQVKRPMEEQAGSEIGPEKKAAQDPWKTKTDKPDGGPGAEHPVPAPDSGPVTP